MEDEASYLIEKKKLAKWKSITTHALKNKTVFTSDVNFIDVDGQQQTLTINPDQALLNAIWNCISNDEDDQVEAFNQYYYKIKCNTEQIIQYRKARGNYLKVRSQKSCVAILGDFVFKSIRLTYNSFNLQFVFLQVAEDTMRTQYELKKKERSSMLANMSLEQHAFSFDQKNQFKIPELPSASCNTREKMESMKETSSPSTPAKSLQHTPAKSLQQTFGAMGAGSKQQEGGSQEKSAEQPAGTQVDNEDDTDSCYQTTVQESKRKRKWYTLF